MRITLVVIALAICLPSSLYASPKTADLDGDGKKESVWVTSVPGTREQSAYTILHVGKSELRFPMSVDGDDNVTIIDIDKSDKYREIAIKHYSGGEIADHTILWFDGKQVRKMHQFSGWIECRGNGVLLNTVWNCYVAYTEKYVLDKKTRSFTHVPQELYSIGYKLNVEKSFPIYYSRQSKNVVASVEVKSKVELVAYVPPRSDKEDIFASWFLVRTHTGLLGWAQMRALSDNTDGLKGAG